jgi:hypothetical protein
MRKVAGRTCLAGVLLMTAGRDRLPEVAMTCPADFYVDCLHILCVTGMVAKMALIAGRERKGISDIRNKKPMIRLCERGPIFIPQKGMAGCTQGFLISRKQFFVWRAVGAVTEGAASKHRPFVDNGIPDQVRFMATLSKTEKGSLATVIPVAVDGVTGFALFFDVRLVL